MAMELFFETFNVPAIYIQMQAVLSLYAAGRTTGVVLDSGDGVTHCVPVYEGFAIEPAQIFEKSIIRSFVYFFRIQRIDVAGRDVTRHLKLLLRKEGHIFHRTSEFEIVREIKERVCTVASSAHPIPGVGASKDEKKNVSSLFNIVKFQKIQPSKSFTMPDGSVIEIGSSHYQAPEVLFRPELMGYEYQGIPACVYNSVQVCFQ